MSLATTVSFWHQVDIWPVFNWPTVIVAFVIGFLSSCASAFLYDMIKVHFTGDLPWDRINRETPRRRFWTYLGSWVSVGVCCGVVAVGVALAPLVGVIAAGVAPGVALKVLGGGASDWDDGRGRKKPEERGPGGAGGRK